MTARQPQLWGFLKYPLANNIWLVISSHIELSDNFKPFLTRYNLFLFFFIWVWWQRCKNIEIYIVISIKSFFFSLFLLFAAQSASLHSFTTSLKNNSSWIMCQAFSSLAKKIPWL